MVKHRRTQMKVTAAYKKVHGLTHSFGFKKWRGKIMRLTTWSMCGLTTGSREIWKATVYQNRRSANSWKYIVSGRDFLKLLVCGTYLTYNNMSPTNNKYTALADPTPLRWSEKSYANMSHANIGIQYCIKVDYKMEYILASKLTVIYLHDDQ